MMFGLFSSDDGCGNHHWGDWKAVHSAPPEVQVEDIGYHSSGRVLVEVKVLLPEKRVCQHVGCTVQQHEKRVKKKWKVDKKHVNVDDFIEAIDDMFSGVDNVTGRDYR